MMLEVLSEVDRCHPARAKHPLDVVAVGEGARQANKGICLHGELALGT